MTEALVPYTTRTLDDTMTLGKVLAQSGYFADSREAAQAVAVNLRRIQTQMFELRQRRRDGGDARIADRALRQADDRQLGIALQQG